MSLRVLRLAAGATFQDLGRSGWRKCGVPTGGAFDRESHLLALALVGRSEGVTLEIPMMGGAFEALTSDFISVTGADAKLDLNVSALRTNSAFPIKPGDRLAIAPCDCGARVYMASFRGWEVKERLGSVSGIEPEHEITAHSEFHGSVSPLRRLGESPHSLQGGPLRFVVGPQARESDVNNLRQAAFQVALASNRVGIRLEGGSFDPVAELPSEPSCVGAVQLAPSGELLIHGADGPTIGGYPKIAVIIRADFDRLGQLRPMDEVSFEEMSLEEARMAYEAESRRLDRWLQQIRLAQ